MKCHFCQNQKMSSQTWNFYVFGDFFVFWVVQDKGIWFRFGIKRLRFLNWETFKFPTLTLHTRFIFPIGWVWAWFWLLWIRVTNVKGFKLVRWQWLWIGWFCSWGFGFCHDKSLGLVRGSLEDRGEWNVWEGLFEFWSFGRAGYEINYKKSVLIVRKYDIEMGEI